MNAPWTPSLYAMEFMKRNAGKMPDLWISRKLGIPTYRIRQYRSKLGVGIHRGRPRMPREEALAVLAMRRAGLTVVWIAKRFGLTRQRIYQVLSENRRTKHGGHIRTSSRSGR